MEPREQQPPAGNAERVYVQDFAVQWFPTWLAVLILIVLAFGLWKLVSKIL
jgi:hypothetical protein